MEDLTHHGYNRGLEMLVLRWKVAINTQDFY